MTVRDLAPGENAPVTSGAATMTIDPVPAETVMLLLDAGDRAIGAPVPIAASGQPMLLGELPPAVQRCVLLAAGLRAAVPTVTVSAPDGPTLRFTLTRAIADPTVLLVEFYRRDGGWKVRALGHGHRDDLAEVVADHGAPGVSGPDAPDPSATPGPIRTPTVSGISAASGPVTERTAEQWQYLLAAIWEDASRSAVTFADAVRFADDARARTLEALVADVAGRAADHPERQAADRRHHEIVESASTRRAAELDHLIAELAELEQTLPAPLARWEAATWHRPLPGAGLPLIRVGEVTRPDSQALRIPMIATLGVPGGLLLVIGGGVIEAPVTHLVQRILSAGPPGRPVRVIADDPAILAALGAAPAAHPAADRIADLATEIDLIDMARQAGDIKPARSPSVLPGVLVVPLLQVEFDETTRLHLERIAVLGPQFGLTVVFIADVDQQDGVSLRFAPRMVPTVPAQTTDPWTGQRWDFLPDAGTPAPQVLDRIGDRARPAD